MTAAEVVKKLEASGWVLARQTGSHAHFMNPSRPTVLVTVAMHPGDVPKGTLRNIERSSGVKLYMIYTARYEREDDGRYSVHVPDLPGCASWGATLVEAQERIAEAIAGWIEAAHAEGMSIPAPKTLAAPVESMA